MVSESVNKVLEAEKMASELIEKAHADAKKINENAKKSAVELKDKMIVDAMNKESELTDEAGERSVSVKKSVEVKIESEKEKLMAAASEKEKDAIDAIVKIILNN